MEGIARGFPLPSATIVTDPQALYIAIGILGATVMPHNLYLHSSIVQTRAYARTPVGKREAIRYSQIDSMVAVTLALCVNAAILVVSAATFHRAGHTAVAEIGAAVRSVAPLAGDAAAAPVFSR